MPSKAMILIAVIFMDLLAGMEFDLFVPSFPQLQAHFKLEPVWVEVLLSINFIGYTLGLFLVGSFADRHGRKPLILLGLSIFTLASILCLQPYSYTLLIIGRFFQGIGIAAPAILSFLVIADTYPLKQQQFLLAMLNALMNVSVGIAPILGSYLSLYFHWQGNFAALLLLGCLSLGLSLAFVPQYKVPTIKSSSQETKKNFFSGYIQLFHAKNLMLLITHIVLMCIPYWIFVGISPLLYMEALGVDLKHFGFYQGILAFIFALGCFIQAFFIHKLSQRQWFVFAQCLYVFSLFCLIEVLISETMNPLHITLGFLPFVISQIIPSNILYPLALHFQPEDKGKISALMQGSKLMLSALFLQIVAVFYTGSFRNIGLILAAIILSIIITMFFILRNESIVNFKFKG